MKRFFPAIVILICVSCEYNSSPIVNEKISPSVNSSAKYPNYSIMDVYDPTVPELYYAIEARDTSFVDSYINTMDTIEFDYFYGMSVDFSARLFRYGYEEDEIPVNQMNKEIVRYNTVSVLRIYFESCLLFDSERTNTIDTAIYNQYGQFEKKLTQEDLDEITGIIDSLCQIH